MKRMLILIAGIVMVVMFGGCAGKGTISNVSKNYYNNGKNIYLIDSNSDFAKNDWAFQLQEVSEFGLKHGWRYFAIVKPKRISNTEGAMFNTFEDINKFCNDNPSQCGENMVGDPYWIVKYFKKQPIKYVTFDAKAVIRDLKQRGLYLAKVPKGVLNERFSNKLSFEKLSQMSY